MSHLVESSQFINFAACSKIAFILLALFAASPATSANTGSNACDSNYSGMEYGDNQALLQHMKGKSSTKTSKEGTPFRMLKKVGSCRATGGTSKMWFGLIKDIGNKTPGDCWHDCQENRPKTDTASYDNNGIYAYCFCITGCKCMTAPGLSNTLAPADFSGRLPKVCTDCPQVGGIYKYTGPSADPTGILEIKQIGCVGTVSGQGRFTTLLDESGGQRIGMRTASGSKWSTQGIIMKKDGLREIHWSSSYGYVFKEIDVLVEPIEFSIWGSFGWWGTGPDSPPSRLDGWDVLGTTECAAGAVLFRGRPIPSSTGDYGLSSVYHCAHYAESNEATFFSYSKCPLPEPKFELRAKGCPRGGRSRCLNGNHAYDSFAEAWTACGLVEGCGVIIKWLKGKYFLRRNTDPVFQGRRRYLRTASLGMSYHCPAERRRCDIWNKCRTLRSHTSFSAFQVACPSANDICLGNASITIGCEEPLCDIPPLPEFH